jgi:hypothetical protein
LKQDVYKVGYTENIKQRMSQSIAMAIFAVPAAKAVLAETAMLAMCRKELKARRDIGTEYFEGQFTVLRDIVGMASGMFVSQLQKDGLVDTESDA